jgi:beta-phosphoglucomutase family hydrolase
MEIGALFDWDGVIIDSARQHEESWKLLARELGQTLPAGHFKSGFGRKNEAIISGILGWASDPAQIQRLSMRKEELYRELVIAQGTVPLPGVREFLERLRAAGVPTSIGSSTHRANIETIFAITGLARYFDHVVAAEDVSEGKPNPEVFLVGAAKIGRAPNRCIVFEDALAGLQAAQAGGMCAVAVATTHPVAGLEAWADRVVTQLDELSVEDLENVVRHHRSRAE